MPLAYTRSELVRWWGVSALRVGLKRGYATRLLPNAYVATLHRDNPVALGSAINAWCPHALVSGRSALHLFNSQIEFQLPMDVVVPYGVRVRQPDWVRIRTLDPLSASTAPQGVDCVPSEFALLDAWHRAPAVDRESLFYQAMWMRICTPRALRRVMDRAPRVADRRRLLRLLDAMEAGATSPLEVLAKKRVFRGPPFRDFEWQGEVRTRTSVRRADMLHRVAKVAVEFDGDRWHTSPETVKRDRVRDAELLAAGYATLRFGYADLRHRPQDCRETVLEVVRGRLPGA